jgi:hypothetical protein
MIRSWGCTEIMAGLYNQLACLSHFTNWSWSLDPNNRWILTTVSNMQSQETETLAGLCALLLYWLHDVGTNLNSPLLSCFIYEMGMIMPILEQSCKAIVLAMLYKLYFWQCYIKSILKIQTFANNFCIPVSSFLFFIIVCVIKLWS